LQKYSISKNVHVLKILGFKKLCFEKINFFKKLKYTKNCIKKSDLKIVQLLANKNLKRKDNFFT
jgi:hypothetical protein